ncbi:hypothetical protein C7I85_30045 [Mesorhizobium soli]|uniref:Uncharacterized protein n=1 Tax=Pseudaminobacter soli (ex Li et al. 2025) TaxID=1295366 RepID=A0A2P7RJY0_9HYPH|nr:hypothetical protein C7I85_30045 [Mesorhizobium soli]
MVQKARYDVSAWKLQPLTGPDPHDDFSQDAATNKRPKHGVGNEGVASRIDGLHERLDRAFEQRTTRTRG